MGNVSRTKKVLAIVLAVTCMMAFSFGTVFAADSPTKGKVKKAKSYYVIPNTAGKTATYSNPASKKTTKITVAKTVSYKGKTYKVTSIKAKAFKGSKAKVIKLTGNVTKISKKAFYGSKVGKSKITVKIKKSAYTKKQRASLKKQLKAAGIKHIKFY